MRLQTKLFQEEDGQYVIGHCKSDSFMYPNLSLCKEADQKLRKVAGEGYFTAINIISKSHQRGKDEWVHRSIIELATKKQLPFKRIGINRAYYFLHVLTHFFFETYKRDVAQNIIPAKAYPITFRRILIDFAVKITSQARYKIIKVSKAIYDRIKVHELWKRCQSPLQIQ